MSPLALGAILGSLVLLGLRLWLGTRVGYGDAEALYASYASFPQPGYLDHPGLIGSVARWLGDGAPPPARLIHLFSAVLGGLVPWVGYFAARRSGATQDGALTTCLALLLFPELSVGLFGFTPDLLLVPLWLLALGAAAAALRAPLGSATQLAWWLLVGGALGLGALSKVSMVMLGLALLAVLLSPPGRPQLKTLGPYAGLVTCAILLMPLALWERGQGYPMLTHRLVTTQGEAGFSLRNLGALIGGQLLYATPPFLIGGYWVLRRLRPLSELTHRLLAAAIYVPLVGLGLLCLWSPVAEPHWLGPAYLAAAVGLGLMPEVATRWLRRSAVILGVFVWALGALLVGTDLAPRLLKGTYEPRYDLANDLYAWRSGLEVVRQTVTEARARRPGAALTVVAPHWTLCAQVHAGLAGDVDVGCQTPGGDDFQLWWPEARWAGAEQLVYVTDDRFQVNLTERFPKRRAVARKSSLTLRGGRVVRRVEVSLLERQDFAAR
ncbi:MAG: glycosyltransferase family 39 protein [Polyangiaceae bacterium]|nr:glycosyltransferase family 39 protein [Polyangiaceae bacterium]MCW5791309.1 glycosyltransferase family 39 protein [Polyangiaceae bacterium]